MVGKNNYAEVLGICHAVFSQKSARCSQDKFFHRPCLVFDVSLQLYATHKYTNRHTDDENNSKNINYCRENDEKFLGLYAWQPVLVLIER